MTSNSTSLRLSELGGNATESSVTPFLAPLAQTAQPFLLFSVERKHLKAEAFNRFDVFAGFSGKAFVEFLLGHVDLHRGLMVE